MTPAVCIDRVNLVYCVNIGPSHADVPYVYVEDQIQNPSVYAYNPDVNYEGLGRIAVIQFLGNPRNKRISVRMKGMLNVLSQFITNPVEAIEHFFLTYGDWATTDFDGITLFRAKQICIALTYTVHWLFDKSESYNYWLSIWSWYLLADIATTAASQLAITIDVHTLIPAEDVWWRFDASVDCLGDDPEDNPELVADVENIVSLPTYKTHYSWTQDHYGQEVPLVHPFTTIAYGLDYTRTLELPGIRDGTHLGNWAQLYFSRMGLDPLKTPVPATLTFSVPALRFAGLMPGTYILFTWRFGPHPLGQGWTGRILKIIQTTVDGGSLMSEPTMTFRCLDTQLVYTGV
jgi:hypothetical protein